MLLVPWQKGPSTRECCSWGRWNWILCGTQGHPQNPPGTNPCRASREGRILGEAQLHPSCQLTPRCHSGNLFMGAKPLIILLEGAPESSFRCFICSVNAMLDARLPTLKPDCIGEAEEVLSSPFISSSSSHQNPSGFCKLSNSRRSFQGDSDGLGLPEQQSLRGEGVSASLIGLLVSKSCPLLIALFLSKLNLSKAGDSFYTYKAGNFWHWTYNVCAVTRAPACMLLDGNCV